MTANKFVKGYADAVVRKRAIYKEAPLEENIAQFTFLKTLGQECNPSWSVYFYNSVWAYNIHDKVKNLGEFQKQSFLL